MSERNLITLNGQDIEFSPGETVLEIAARQGTEIPTLCHDPRLEPAGACRTCLVEIEGWRRMPPSCATKAMPGMVVSTESDRIGKHRETLLSLYLTDHTQDRQEAETYGPDELFDMAERYGAVGDWGAMETEREARDSDRNPYIHFKPESCIVCARCVRYCEEIEGVSAITLSGRGSKTTISTVDQLSLLDTTCEMCGGCIDVCPTGAMAEKMPLTRSARPERELEKIRSTCNFCGVGCQVDLNVDPAANEGQGKVVKVTSPAPGTTTNDGNLCVKGRFAYDFVDHPERIQVPLIRDADGEFREASWEEALQRAAEGLQGVRDRHGADSLAFVSSSRCTMEENYLMQKFSRGVFGTNNIHQCAAT